MRQLFNILSVFVIIVLLQQCKVVDPPEKIPSFLYINDIIVNTNSSIEGSDFDNISDAWVYVDGTLIGAFELPAKVPVIPKHESYTLEIFAGIKNSGFVAQRYTYPFFNSYKITKQHIPNHTDTIIPVVTYKSISTIWVEDFEDPGLKFSSPLESDTSMTITNDISEVREGSGSGKIEFGPSDIYVDSRTNEPLFNNFQKGGSPIYIEMEYNINYPITIGLLHGDNSLSSLVKSPYITLNSTNGGWNKTYLDLTEAVSSKTSATKYQFYIQLNRDTTFLNPLILFDNIKVVFY